MQVLCRRTEHATRSVWRNAASPTMRSTVYKTVSRQSVRPSVCLSVPSMYSCNSVRRVCCCGLRGTAGGGDIVDRLLPGASAAFRSMSTTVRRTAANASSVALPAAVERWTYTRMIAAFVFRLDLKTATESLLRTVFGSEFQTAGAEHRKAPFANVAIVKGWHNVVVVDRRLWPCSRSWIRRRRYDGVEVLRTLNIFSSSQHLVHFKYVPSHSVVLQECDAQHFSHFRSYVNGSAFAVWEQQLAGSDRQACMGVFTQQYVKR